MAKGSGHMRYVEGCGKIRELGREYLQCMGRKISEH